MSIQQKYESKIARKQLYRYFKGQTDEITYEKIWRWLRKGNFKREPESLLIAAENNAIQTNYIKAKIYDTRENNKWWVCSNKDEMSYHVRIKCSKQLQKKSGDDLVGMLIHLE